jgi:hypothetical protein
MGDEILFKRLFMSPKVNNVGFSSLDKQRAIEVIVESIHDDLLSVVFHHEGYVVEASFDKGEDDLYAIDNVVSELDKAKKELDYIKLLGENNKYGSSLFFYKNGPFLEFSDISSQNYFSLFFREGFDGRENEERLKLLKQSIEVSKRNSDENPVHIIYGKPHQGIKSVLEKAIDVYAFCEKHKL